MPLRSLPLFLTLLIFLGCSKSPEPATAIPETTAAPEHAALLQIGSIRITQADLDYQLQQKYRGRNDETTRTAALEELATRARFIQAALDAHIDQDPAVRAEIAKILANHHKELTLSPELQKAAAPIPEARLRELYATHLTRFQSPEQRQVAVLWLNPGNDPERKQLYRNKLEQARDWYHNDPDLQKHPEKGFSILAIDYSEHAPTRFKSGILDWLTQDSQSNEWEKTVSENTFTLKAPGELSPIIDSPQGLFLIRLIKTQAPVEKSFETVRPQIEREEQTRLKAQATAAYNQSIQATHP